MLHRKTVSTGTAQTDRRSGRDRRQVDKGPPSGRERRVGMEPRKPEVQELDFTPSEWTALQDSVDLGKGGA